MNPSSLTKALFSTIAAVSLTSCGNDQSQRYDWTKDTIIRIVDSETKQRFFYLINEDKVRKLAGLDSSYSPIIIMANKGDEKVTVMFSKGDESLSTSKEMDLNLLLKNARLQSTPDRSK